MVFAIKKLSSYLTYIAAGMLVLMMLHVVGDIIGRYFFKAPAPATAEFVAYYYMVAAVFLPLAYTELRGRSIAVDLFYDMFPEKIKRGTRGFALVCGMCFFAALTYKTSIDALNAFDKGEMVDGFYVVIIWPGRFLLPLGMGLTTIILALRFFVEVIFNRGPLYDEEEPSGHIVAEGTE